MTDNPLMNRMPASAGKVTKEMLFDYCDRLNRCFFVQDSGKPYRVVQREMGGELKWCLDRDA